MLLLAWANGAMGPWALKREAGARTRAVAGAGLGLGGGMRGVVVG